ncbi:MAG: peptidylprolyl isomerase [Gemmatimonadetes bacterium]|nr:peptidylprolyl isomerase [Gemmatimonadota bacterium]
MSKLWAVSWITSIVASTVLSQAAETQTPSRVLMRTDLGDIILEVYPERAPITVANFLRYVDEGRLDSASFYRAVTLNNQPNDSVRIQVIQGGLRGHRDMVLPPIELETTDVTGMAHLDGTLSMARAAVGTASSEFFICIGAQPELDYGGKRNADGQGFAAFGRVVEGMEVVRAIQSGALQGQMLQEPVRIVSVSRL